MTWQCSEMIEEAAALASLGLTSDSDAFIEKPFRFALRVRGIDSRYDLKTVVLAAESQEELEIWNDFSKQLQVNAHLRWSLCSLFGVVSNAASM